MSQNVVALLRRGLSYQESGDGAKAEKIYGEVLEREPGNADAWHLLSRLAMVQGEWKTAAARALQAIRSRPDIPAFHSSLGEILAVQGMAEQAALCYREALRLQPAFVPALVNLGNALQGMGRYREACVQYWRAIQGDPDCVEAFCNLGNALRAQGRHDEALICYQEAVRLRPADPEVSVNLSAAYLQLSEDLQAEEWARRALACSPGLTQALSNLSVALLNQGRLEEAETTAREALRNAPRAPHLHSNLGSALLQRKKFQEAEAACRRALELRPGYPEAANNLGVSLQLQDRLEEAAAQFEEVLRDQPEFAEAWTNLGTVRQAQGRNTEALACFEVALRHNPAHVKTHFCRSLSLLLAGRYLEGFSEYEWRWKVIAGTPRAVTQPLWEGEPLAGRSILLFTEQGLGDTIQFVRFAPIVAAFGGPVILDCQAPIVPVVRTVQGLSKVIAEEDALPPFDLQAGLMSVPRILGTTADTIPAIIPYVRASQLLVDEQRRRLGERRGLRVGLAWAGNPQHDSDRHRSFPLEVLSPLRRIPGIEWYSLHIGKRRLEEIRRAGGWPAQVLSESGGVSELAALMCCLDLVITADTMPAHLAGALGRPVWTLLSSAADWRWRESGDQTPWYPTMRLFRQPRKGDWNSVVARVAREVADIPGSNYFQMDR